MIACQDYAYQIIGIHGIKTKHKVSIAKSQNSDFQAEYLPVWTVSEHVDLWINSTTALLSYRLFPSINQNTQNEDFVALLYHFI